MWIIFVITLVIVAAGGYVYYQKQKITSMLSEKKTVGNSEDKVLLGQIIEVRENSVVIQVSGSNVPMEYEVNINAESMIYQDQNVTNGAPIVSDKSILKTGSNLVVGLTGSKNDKKLFAETIHVLPEIK